MPLIEHLSSPCGELFSGRYSFLIRIIYKALTYQAPFRCQFILDCTVFPDAISLTQTYGKSATDKFLDKDNMFFYSHRTLQKPWSMEKLLKFII